MNGWSVWDRTRVRVGFFWREAKGDAKPQSPVTKTFMVPDEKRVQGVFEYTITRLCTCFEQCHLVATLSVPHKEENKNRVDYLLAQPSSWKSVGPEHTSNTSQAGQ